LKNALFCGKIIKLSYIFSWQERNTLQIRNCYEKNRPVLSFEVFPPKRDADIDTVYRALGRLAGLSPDFISVTYGAGGSGIVNKTCEIASVIKNTHGVEALAHLTCVGSGKERINALVDDLQAQNIHNILAMRGDPPADGSAPPASDYQHACDLIREIKARGGFCIGAACYPEGHIDCEEPAENMRHLLCKQVAGADFLITQLFFDNDLFWRFLEKARAAGVTLPISAGVMPILSRGQIERMIFLCGASLPSAIIKLLHRYEHSPGDLRAAGIEHAVRQMEALATGGADGVHIYTMNQPDIAATAIERLRQ